MVRTVRGRGEGSRWARGSEPAPLTGRSSRGPEVVLPGDADERGERGEAGPRSRGAGELVGGPGRPGGPGAARLRRGARWGGRAGGRRGRGGECGKAAGGREGGAARGSPAGAEADLGEPGARRPRARRIPCAAGRKGRGVSARSRPGGGR